MIVGGTPLRHPLRNPTVPGRPYPPEVVAALRALVEGAGLSQREAAARSGLPADTVGRWARRFGWRRGSGGGVEAGGGADSTLDPSPPGEGRVEAKLRTGVGSRPAWVGPHPGRLTPTRPPLAGEGSGAASTGRGTPRPHRYGPEVREAARVRIEGTREGLERIGLALGIDRWTLHRWQKRFGWQRPPPPDRLVLPRDRRPDFYRSRRLGRPYGGDAVSTARDLVLGSTLPLDRVAARAGVSRATLYRWIAQRGWTRPPEHARGHGHRRPYGPEVVAAARELYQITELSTRMIAARVRTTREWVRHWARQEGWTRPRDDPDPHGRYRRRRKRRRPAEGGEASRRAGP